jgi:hypothetical protein
LGINTFPYNYLLIPTFLENFFSNVVQVSAGENHTMVLSNGFAYSCGLNFNCQLGLNSMIDTEILTQIPINKKISNIFASRFHSLININPYICNGISQYDQNVCSGKGNCIDNKCVCNFKFFGNDCQYTTCDGIASSNITVCSSHGKFLINYRSMP